MKNHSILFLIVLMSFTSCKSQSFKAMTYNIRLDVASDGENAWEHRKGFLTSQVLFFAPDILGVQEAKPNQMADLKEALKTYNAIGIGRDGGNEGEYSAVFYNNKKFKVEKENTFWLSETPEIVSKGWDAAYPRICTYGLFTDLKTSKKIWIFNTHLDHKGEQAQLKGIEKIQKKIAEVNTKNYPVILMGDFNVEPNSLLIKNLSESMLNSETVSKLTFGPNGTFNGFKFHEPVTRKIDYIFISNSKTITVNKQAVFSDSSNMKYPSDHFPVYVECILD
ncbi:endonuclease/exonuclease/phosphatase family protein [Mariniflexile sp. AS56]|uniref:endonuclease/exonuclease/phosphatase family protein n=1 Tax=Mariniflexile sp. AS56 TaxID=3063957 RepID=UPI0026EE98E3|nr:endonuclease/exonuclease/phosphatase family protein [Mariniflexile sp. AS56]MDO7171749.1 endonuclease/exonuclease/phosphatase family protein [Mariniflexile sp. AS56]